MIVKNSKTTIRSTNTPYLKGQGHSMTLQQNRVRHITSLFEVGFQNYFTEMITILRRSVARKILLPTLQGQCHSATLQQNRVRPITSFFEVGFQNYFTEMITILRRSVARNICVPTFKVKAQLDLAAKSCSAHNFVIWCPEIENILQKW